LRVRFHFCGSVLLGTNGVFCRNGRRRSGTQRDATGGHVSDDAVRDLQDTTDLLEGRHVGREREQVVHALGLVVDLVGELAPAPDLWRLEGSAFLLDLLARARENLLLPLLRELRIQDEKNLVFVHVPACSFPWSESAPPGARRPGPRRGAWREV